MLTIKNITFKVCNCKKVNYQYFIGYHKCYVEDLT